ncbi:MAG TPA: hypothetical protein VFU22_11900 [Roseiflexaceae bacterium]|nr:hypothetical protein [Roseiflexaceae bacterium]
MEHEQVNRAVARRSALIYLPLSLGVALLFLLAATLGGYPVVARIGGTVWVWVLSLIVTMPIVTTQVKQRVWPPAD